MYISTAHLSFYAISLFNQDLLQFFAISYFFFFWQKLVCVRVSAYCIICIYTIYCSLLMSQRKEDWYIAGWQAHSMLCTASVIAICYLLLSTSLPRSTHTNTTFLHFYLFLSFYQTNVPWDQLIFRILVALAHCDYIVDELIDILN